VCGMFLHLASPSELTWARYRMAPYPPFR
jgi:hypothetical protein